MEAKRVVLVVDDEEAILDVVEWALEDEGYEVTRTADGREALALLASLRPNLVLLDMRMPGMNGWEFCEAYAKQANLRAPIVIMTAAQDASRLAAEVGARGFLGKPFDVDALIAVVGQYASS